MAFSETLLPFYLQGSEEDYLGTRLFSRKPTLGHIPFDEHLTIAMEAFFRIKTFSSGFQATKTSSCHLVIASQLVVIVWPCK